MIAQVTYERLYNLGNYENMRLAATAIVESSTEAAFTEARHAVEEQHALFLTERAEAANRAREERLAAQRRYEEQIGLQMADDADDADDAAAANDTEDDDADDGFHL